MAGRILPVVFIWRAVDIVGDEGEVVRGMAMVPLNRFDNVCKRQFVDLEEYPLAPIEARSRKSHNQYFAAIHDAFLNLPEDVATRFPTEEHLRKWVLIECDWFDEKEFDCDDQKQANRLGLFIRGQDEYARISFHRSSDPKNKRVKVIMRQAKSQSAAMMGRDEFYESKTAVLNYLEVMIGVEKGTLNKEAGSNAA